MLLVLTVGAVCVVVAIARAIHAGPRVRLAAVLAEVATLATAPTGHTCQGEHLHKQGGSQQQAVCVCV